ncbi:MAG: hypothetical protein IPL99_11595 [Candidatus Competibacteraceae bacterium]|nr:hypothetical protein [Candidatus Competibacteraceae bacterium]
MRQQFAAEEPNEQGSDPAVFFPSRFPKIIELATRGDPEETLVCGVVQVSGTASQLQILFRLAQRGGDFGEMFVERSRVDAQLAQFGFKALKLLFNGIEIGQFRVRWFRQGFQTQLRLFQEAGFLLEQLPLLLLQLRLLNAAVHQALQRSFDQMIEAPPHQLPAGVLFVVGEADQPVVAKVDDGLGYVPPEDVPAPSRFRACSFRLEPRRTRRTALWVGGQAPVSGSSASRR